ncbi:MAG TPA: hypothetical protein VN615_01990, partial [Gaiellales bacterium]|nr:hypothetical protein [Gaiellales bacterium]
KGGDAREQDSPAALGQVGTSDEPHSSQNRAPSPFSWPQLVQISTRTTIDPIPRKPPLRLVLTSIFVFWPR